MLSCGAVFGGDIFRCVHPAHIRAVRAYKCATSLQITLTVIAQCPEQIILGLGQRFVVRSLQRQCGNGKGRLCSVLRRRQSRKRDQTVFHDIGTMRRHLRLKCAIPMRIAHHVLEQAIAFTHRLFIAQHSLGMTRFKGHYHAIQKPPAPLRPLNPQPVHCWNEPNHTRNTPQRKLCCGFAVDLDRTRLPRLRPCFNVMRLMKGPKFCTDLPPQTLGLSSNVIGRGAPQPTPRRQ